jgi:hypothetical protein
MDRLDCGVHYSAEVPGMGIHYEAAEEVRITCQRSTTRPRRAPFIHTKRSPGRL